MNGTCTQCLPALKAKSRARFFSISMFNMEARGGYSMPICSSHTPLSHPTSTMCWRNRQAL